MIRLVKGDLERRRSQPHCCRNVQPESSFGGPEQLIERGVDDAAAVTARFAEQIDRALLGATTNKQIRAALRELEFNDEALAEVVEGEILMGLMLGALDAAFEVDENVLVDATSFAQLPVSDRWLMATSAKERLLVMGVLLVEADKKFAARPLEQALRAFQRKQVVTRDVFDKMTKEAKKRSFTVARMASTAMVDTVRNELVSAMDRGADLRDFRKFAKERLESAGWTPANSSHVETIFRTNVMEAYNGGRHRQMTQPAVLALRPYWQVVNPNDGPPRQRKTHQECYLKVFRADDPVFPDAIPPWDFNCRDHMRSLSQRQVDNQGLSITDGSFLTSRKLPAPGFGGSGGISGDFFGPKVKEIPKAPEAPPAAPKKPRAPRKPKAPPAPTPLPPPVAPPVPPPPPPAPAPAPQPAPPPEPQPAPKPPAPKPAPRKPPAPKKPPAPPPAPKKPPAPPPAPKKPPAPPPVAAPPAPPAPAPPAPVPAAPPPTEPPPEPAQAEPAPKAPRKPKAPKAPKALPPLRQATPEEQDAGFDEERKALPLLVKSARVSGRTATRHREVVYAALDEVGAGKMYSQGRNLGRLVVTEREATGKESKFDDTIRRGANGVAWSGGGASATLKIRAVGRAVKPGPINRGWSVSETRDSANEAIRATTIHEFGHLVHLDASQTGFYDQHKQIDALVKARFDAADREELSRYSRSNHKEYFAESFASYHLERDWFRRTAPKAFAMVEDALRIRGIL